MTDSVIGWHPDPNDPRIMRYWTGVQWSGQRSWDGANWIDHAAYSVPASPSPVPVFAAPAYAGQVPPPYQGFGPLGSAAKPPVSPRVRKRLMLVIAGAALGLAGSVLPWASRDYAGVASTTINGSSAGGGQVCIVLSIVIAVLAGMALYGTIGARRSTVAVLVLGALMLVISIANITSLEDLITKEKTDSSGLDDVIGGTIHEGVGLLVLLVGGALVVVASILVLVAGRSRRTTG